MDNVTKTPHRHFTHVQSISYHCFQLVNFVHRCYCVVNNYDRGHSSSSRIKSGDQFQFETHRNSLLFIRSFFDDLINASTNRRLFANLKFIRKRMIKTFIIKECGSNINGKKSLHNKEKSWNEFSFTSHENNVIIVNYNHLIMNNIHVAIQIMTVKFIVEANYRNYNVTPIMIRNCMFHWAYVSKNSLFRLLINISAWLPECRASHSRLITDSNYVRLLSTRKISLYRVFLSYEYLQKYRGFHK